MNKIEQLERLISNLKIVINCNYYKRAEDYIYEIVRNYKNDIPNISEGLALDYTWEVSEETAKELNTPLITSGTNYYEVLIISDLRTLLTRLDNYKDELKEEELRRKEELEILRLQNGKTTGYRNPIYIYNNNSASATVNNNITLGDTISKLDSILSAYEITEIKYRLMDLETSFKKENKKKQSIMMKNVLKFIADKGIDVAIAVIPYLSGLIG